jgi:hypothetical protein
LSISPASHRVAIANSRLVALDERGVTFRYKDYRRNGQARYRAMTLTADEFIRRFLLHVLPKRISSHPSCISMGYEAPLRSTHGLTHDKEKPCARPSSFSAVQDAQPGLPR